MHNLREEKKLDPVQRFEVELRKAIHNRTQITNAMVCEELCKLVPS